MSRKSLSVRVSPAVDPKVVAAAKWAVVVNHIVEAKNGLLELSPSVAAWRHVERSVSNLVRAAGHIEKMGVASVRCNYSEHKAQIVVRKESKRVAKLDKLSKAKAKIEAKIALLAPVANSGS